MAVALGVNPRAIFRTAQRRVAVVFRLNLIACIALVSLFLIGILGAIISGIFLGEARWAAIFGGISAADAVGIYAFKPLDKLDKALVAASRLDAMYLKLGIALAECSHHREMQTRLRCQAKAWDDMQQQLMSLAGPDAALPTA